jgi:hypothetical protein
VYRQFGILLFGSVLSLSPILGLSKDPMRPPNWIKSLSNESVTKDSKLNLQQILISKDRKFAMINETLVSEGESIAGGKIKKITHQWVKVERGGRTLTLRIIPTTKEYRREK